MVGYRNIYFYKTIFLFLFLVSSLFAQYEWPYQKELKEDVRFWKLVFAHYKQNQDIIHHANNLKIIYKVVSFDSTVSERDHEQQIKQEKENIEATLKKLAKKEKEGNPLYTNFELYILNLFDDSTTSEDLYKAAEQIRVQQGMRDRFVEGLSRSLFYLPYLKEVFKGYDLPEELAYLPHIESSFNPLARSRVGASGMWQFMRSTGRLYMKVNRIIDQRFDPLISSRAAAQLLKTSYEEIGDWALALTSYNYGLAGMKRAAEEHNSDYLAVRKYFKSRRFRFASRNFYPEFLAIVEIMNEVDKLFPDVQPAPVPSYIPLQLSKWVNLPKLSKQLGLDIEELKKINPVYTRRAWRGWVNVPKGYWLNLPIENNLKNIDRYFQNIELAVAEPLASKDVSSSIENEESKIKRESGPAIAEFNLNITSTVELQKAEVVTETALTKSTSSNKNDFQKEMIIEDRQNLLHYRDLQKNLRDRLSVVYNHINVFVNETLGHYADWLGIPTQRLRNLNGLRYGQAIYQGQKLNLDFSRVSQEKFEEKRIKYHFSTLSSLFEEKQFVRFKEYEIRAGESLWKLAHSRYKVPIEMIQYLNFHEDINRLYPGDIVRIPIFKTNNSMEETL